MEHIYFQLLFSMQNTNHPLQNISRTTVRNIHSEIRNRKTPLHNAAKNPDRPRDEKTPHQIVLKKLTNFLSYPI